MSELISNKEALIALANGEEVEVSHPHDKWYEDWESLNSSGGKFFLLYLLDETTGYKFRLKPRTIMIGNIEVPAPFEPKDGDVVFVLDNANPDGFSSFVFDSDFFTVNFGAWRTEGEVRQVVAALRSVFEIK